MFGLIMIAVVLAIGALAFAVGVDSREGSTDDRRPESPVALS